MVVVLILFTVAALSAVGQSASTNYSSLPLSIPPSAYWEGDDGLWSTFHVRVGTPAQTVRLLPGTSASAGDTTWVVIPEGCDTRNPEYDSNLTNCADKRGDLFSRNLSTSWSTERLASAGIYSLITVEEDYLGLGGDNAYYGFDTISLGLIGSGLPTVTNQVVAGFGANDFWLGSLGLSPIPFNFTSFDDPQASLLSTLYNQSSIPSLSWAYTAGAVYKTPSVLGSLTLGGYDTTRFTPNNVTFAFGADISRDLLVKLKSITYDTSGSSPLMASGIDVFIDSMVSQIWLPISVCNAFEQAFNLTWNASAEMYLLDQTTHDTLVAQNPIFTFTLANGTGGTVNIVLPYAAFDLNVTQPLVESEMWYFPLERAQNSSQYTLGRVFLQEAYVVADYGRQNFSVSQALFPDTGVSQDLVTIWPPGYEPPHKNDTLSSGAIAGIVVGAVVALALIVAIWFWLRKRTKQRQAETKVASVQHPIDSDEKADLALHYSTVPDNEEIMVQELESSRPDIERKDNISRRYELSAPVKVHEIGSDDAVELEAPSRR